jgi:hypothetical protein
MNSDSVCYPCILADPRTRVDHLNVEALWTAEGVRRYVTEAVRRAS